jgi:hypothetical protein
MRLRKEDIFKNPGDAPNSIKDILDISEDRIYLYFKLLKEIATSYYEAPPEDDSPSMSNQTLLEKIIDGMGGEVSLSEWTYITLTLSDEVRQVTQDIAKKVLLDKLTKTAEVVKVKESPSKEDLDKLTNVVFPKNG